MARIGLAFKLFFRVLGDESLAQRARQLLEGEEKPAVVVPPQPIAASPASPPKQALRSEAIQLLAVLQREARLIDFLKENITPYSDAQIGAAVRDVHRGSAAALERLFALQPVLNDAEGAPVTVPAGADAARIRLTGNVSGSPPYRGTLSHGGWEATKVELPEWTGSQSAFQIIAPAEVEVK